MHLFLIALYFTTLCNQLATSAPAISSVRVSFVSGNKATQYSHDIGGSSPHYKLLSRPSFRTDETGEHNVKRKRSIGILPAVSTSATLGPSSTPAKFFKKKRVFLDPKFGRNFYTTSTTAKTDETTHNSNLGITSTTTESSPTLSILKHTTTTEAATNHSPLSKRLLRTSNVAFIPSTIATNDNSLTLSSTPKNGKVDSAKSESKKRKDSKPVKRSPYLENFDAGGINFPDFDEFGGDEFGSLRNFAGGHGRGDDVDHDDVGSHTHANPESLSPNGVFLPPLPTEASDYADTDPYLADPDTAKYAAQHPPFFAAFPHKRTVLSLNEQRVYNGLEPNILRSLRPYFAFFDAANPRRPGHHRLGHSLGHGYGYHGKPHPPRRPPLLGPPPPPVSYSHSHNVFAPHSHDIFPRQFIFVKRALKTAPFWKSWSIFTKK